MAYILAFGAKHDAGLPRSRRGSTNRDAPQAVTGVSSAAITRSASVKLFPDLHELLNEVRFRRQSAESESAELKSLVVALF